MPYLSLAWPGRVTPGLCPVRMGAIRGSAIPSSVQLCLYDYTVIEGPGIRLRVLLLTSDFLPIKGGVGNYVLQISNRMPSDVEVHIVAPSGEGVRTAELSNELASLRGNVHVHLLDGRGPNLLGRLAFQIECRRNLPKLVKAHAIDLIHTQSEMPDLLVSPRRIGVPIVTTIHTTVEGHIRAIKATGSTFRELNASEKATLLTSPIVLPLEDRYYRQRQHYLTVSNWAKREMSLQKKINPMSIRVVYIGVDGELYNPSKRAFAGEHFPQLADVDKPKVLFFSRLATRKGLGVLLKAIPRILQKADVHFIFAGSGRSKLLDSPLKGCTMLGYIPASEAPYLYASSDVFVLPSLYENFPASILEALATRCSVISTDVGGVSEMIANGKNGLLIRPGSVDDIVNSVVRLIEDRRLGDDLGSAGRRTCEERFNWDRTAMDTYSYYRELTGPQKMAHR